MEAANGATEMIVGFSKMLVSSVTPTSFSMASGKEVIGHRDPSGQQRVGLKSYYRMSR